MSYTKSIRKEVAEMWRLVVSQLTKSLFALTQFDKDYARDVILIEQRVNSSKVLIDSHCENFISLQTERQVNIPFLIAIMKMNMHLERIGDLANNIANQILKTPTTFSSRLIEETKVVEIYRKAANMVALGLDAFEELDASLAEEVLTRAEVFEELRLEVNNLTAAYSHHSPEDRGNALNIYSIIKDLERVVDQSKALANEMISYSENILMIA